MPIEINQAKRQEAVQAKVAAAASKLGQSLRPSDAQELGKIRIKLLNAGFRQEQAVAVYYGIKFIGLLIGLAGAFPPCCHPLRDDADMTYMITACRRRPCDFICPTSSSADAKKSRGMAIFLGLPDALDLMVVCVEAGLGLDAAMRRVTSELAQSCPVICEEFAIANFQLQMGRPRKDVLRDLGIRTGVDDVRALAAVIIQAEKFGSSISSALRVQSDAMRLRRRQLAEERAAKTSVKIMLPLIFFIFPGVFVVLGRPGGNPDVRHVRSTLKWREADRFDSDTDARDSIFTAFVCVENGNVQRVPSRSRMTSSPRVRNRADGELVRSSSLAVVIVPLVVEGAMLTYGQWCEIMGSHDTCEHARSWTSVSNAFTRPQTSLRSTFRPSFDARTQRPRHGDCPLHWS